uniref:Uncharacterized protein n=1 Tax=Arundo donax TaxID=35708 RepID=A0A0A9AXD6_ARUDO
MRSSFLLLNFSALSSAEFKFRKALNSKECQVGKHSSPQARSTNINLLRNLFEQL